MTEWKEAIRCMAAKGYRKTKNGKYEAFASDRCESIYLGSYDTVDEAKDAVFDYRVDRLISGVELYGLNIEDCAVYENNYIVFRNGMIFNLYGRRIIGVVNRNGYRQGILNGHNIDYHKVIADCFIENNENLRDVNHKNGNKLDNRMENLERVTHSENIRHAYRTGLEKPSVGESHHNHKLTDDLVHYIKNSSKNSYELSKELNVDSSTIRDIRRGKTWRHVK